MNGMYMRMHMQKGPRISEMTTDIIEALSKCNEDELDLIIGSAMEQKAALQKEAREKEKAKILEQMAKLISRYAELCGCCECKEC